MRKNDKRMKYIYMIIAVIVVLLIVIACISLSKTGPTTKSKNFKASFEYVVNPENVKSIEGKTNILSNENCNETAIKNKFSLTIVDGLIQVNNLKTMENFTIDKIANATSMYKINYEKTCDNSIYVILTGDGEVFYTYDDVTKIEDLKTIETKFNYANFDTRFTELFIGEEKGNQNLYGKTATNNLYKINLR